MAKKKATKKSSSKSAKKSSGKRSKKSSRKPSKKSTAIAKRGLLEAPLTPTAARSLSEALRAPRGHLDVNGLDAAAHPGYPGKGKEDAEQTMAALGGRMADLQERLYANGRTHVDAPRILVILQGLDTSGKGGVIRSAIGMVDPQGVQLKAFKAPTEEERQHDFLWRIRKELPDPGMIGIFDRSHYEDVLIARVNELVPVEEWQGRYDIINQFEQELVDSGVVLIKCFLNVSAAEQKLRLAERLDNPQKHWKYNPEDLDSRARWSAYMEAFADLLERCNPDHAPFHIIPADRKWYRNWAVAQLLVDALEGLDLEWPAATFDVAAEKERVARS